MNRTFADRLAELRAGALSAEAFWAWVADGRAPIVEPVPDSAEECLVTFVWRDGDPATTGVRVAGGPTQIYGPPEAALEHVQGTDVWFRTFRAPADLRGQYGFIVNDGVDDPASSTKEEMMNAIRAIRRDPLNPVEWIWPERPGSDEKREVRSIVELPKAPPQAWYDPRPDVRAGRLDHFTWTSPTLGSEREVWVYTPADRNPEGSALLFDGWVWAEALPIAPTLDNLIAAGLIPPVNAVFVDYIDNESRLRDLGLSQPFTSALVDELLPVVRERWWFADDASRTIAAGQSLGGLAAAFAALRHPHVFGNVLSQSGSYWWPSDDMWNDNDTIGEEELTKAYEASQPMPVRFFLEVGLLESKKMPLSNRRFRDVLLAKGYDVTYREYSGGHDYVVWRGSLADGLIALTRAWHDG